MPVINEARRLETLADYHATQLSGDPELQRIVHFAAKLCDVPTAIVSLVESERQCFIAREGLEDEETPRSVSFCAHAMLDDELMEIRDATQDDRFAKNALVQGGPQIRFYAGQPLHANDGSPLGALCVIDTKPRPDGLNALQKQGLKVLAEAVMCRMQGHRDALFAAKEIKGKEGQFLTLVDSIPAIAWSTDAEGNFDYFNRRMIEFTGIERADNIDAIHPEDAEAADKAWRHSLTTGEPYEAEHRLRHADGSFRWMMARAIPVRDDTGKIIRWFGSAVDIDAVHKLSDSRDLMARELSHRIKNIFAVVSGLISLTIRKRPDQRELGDELIQTIRALGRAHDFVRPVDGAASDNLRGLLQELFAPYGTGDGARVRVVGDDFGILARSATPLALVFHELATNSAKYGALSVEDGFVELSVSDQDDDLLVLLWEEHGGPPPKTMPTDGFGSRLVEMSVTGQLGGSWERRWSEDGLVVELSLSKKAIAA
nr:PAS domain-containing protein [Altericroceibacterium endophyticum]